MSHEFWAWPKTVWSLHLRIKPQTLIRMRTQHLHRGPNNYPGCFPFKAWVWPFGGIYTKRMKIICLIPVIERSHRTLSHGAPSAATQFGKQDTWFAWSHIETGRTSSRALTSKVPNLRRNRKTLSFLPRPCFCSFTGGGKKAVSSHELEN